MDGPRLLGQQASHTVTIKLVGYSKIQNLLWSRLSKMHLALPTVYQITSSLSEVFVRYLNQSTIEEVLQHGWLDFGFPQALLCCKMYCCFSSFYFTSFVNGLILYLIIVK